MRTAMGTGFGTVLGTGLGTAFLLVVLAGCGDADAEHPVAADDEHPVASTAAVAGTPEDPLRLGESAEVGHHDTSAVGATDPISTLEVSVDRVVGASASDLTAGGLGLDEDQRASDVYYLHATYTNTGAAMVRLPAGPGLDTASGQRFGPLVVVEAGGDYAACPGVPERLAPGATADGCSIVLLPAGAEAVTASFYSGGDPLFVHWRTAR